MKRATLFDFEIEIYLITKNRHDSVFRIAATRIDTGFGKKMRTEKRRKVKPYKETFSYDGQW